MNKFQKDPKELEALQDGVIDFVQKILMERNELLEENNFLKKKLKEEKDFYDKMITMKDEKIDIMRMKIEFLQSSNSKKIERISSTFNLEERKSLRRASSTNNYIQKTFNSNNTNFRDFLNSKSIKDKRKSAESIQKIPLSKDMIKESLTKIRKSVSKEKSLNNSYLSKIKKVDTIGSIFSLEKLKKRIRSSLNPNNSSKFFENKDKKDKKNDVSNYINLTRESMRASSLKRSKLFNKENNVKKMLSPNRTSLLSRNGSLGKGSLYAVKDSINLICKKRYNKILGKNLKKGKEGIFLKGLSCKAKNSFFGEKDGMKESLDRISLSGFTDHFKNCNLSSIKF